MGIILDCLFDGGNDRHSQLRKLFKHIDRNGNGVVTFDEFLTLETHLNKNSADAAKEFFKELEFRWQYGQVDEHIREYVRGNSLHPVRVPGNRA
mgnify:CR=1 FL=1